MASVLCYNLPAEKRIKLQLICTRLKMHVRHVLQDQYMLPIGALCGMLEPGASPAPATETFDDEMLVFCGFDSRLLDRFLAEMRAARMQPVLLKAVLTPSNMHWSSVRLCRELLSERETLQRRKM